MNFPDANGWQANDYRTLLLEANKGEFRPEHWLVVSLSESGLSPRAFNKQGGAKGLTQMMPTTLKNLGWKKGDADFDATGGDYNVLPIEGQIRWSGKYFQDCRGWTKVRTWNSPGDLYLANFLPGLLSHKDDPTFVLAATPTKNYEQNKGFDRDGKGTITVADVRRQASACSTHQAYYNAVSSLNAVRQARLNECLSTRAPLDEDGAIGSKTADAIKLFRYSAGLSLQGAFDAALDIALFGV